MDIKIYVYFGEFYISVGGGGSIYMGLLVFDAGHKEVYVTLYICGEVFHELVELWPGSHIDATPYSNESHYSPSIPNYLCSALYIHQLAL